MYIQAREKFQVKSPLGLHSRPSGRLAKALKQYLENDYIESADVYNGHRQHFDAENLPDLTNFTSLGLSQGAELEISIKVTEKRYKTNLFRRIKRILDKTYVRNEERTLPLHLISMS